MLVKHIFSAAFYKTLRMGIVSQLWSSLFEELIWIKSDGFFGFYIMYWCFLYAFIEACEGADAVFHMAAPDSSINNFNLHYSVTVQGYEDFPHNPLGGVSLS